MKIIKNRAFRARIGIEGLNVPIEAGDAVG